MALHQLHVLMRQTQKSQCRDVSVLRSADCWTKYFKLNSHYQLAPGEARQSARLTLMVLEMRRMWQVCGELVEEG